MAIRDPLPSYTGIATFLRAPLVDPEDVQPGTVAIIGAPHDCATRQGSRAGPKAIREGSLHLAYYFETADNHELLDVSSGKTVRWDGNGSLVDTGDVNIYPTNIEKTGQAISAAVERVTAQGAFPVTLGGDHFITYPCVRGFVSAVRRKKKQARVGYLHLDAHLDLGDESPVFGKLSNATNARRVAELEGVSPKNMVMVGIRGYVRKDQWDFIRETGIRIFTMGDVRRKGLAQVIREATRLAGQGCDVVYFTLDMDVVDAAYAPGVGGVAFGGLTSAELLEAVTILAGDRKIGALDVVEVNPSFDVGEITARLAVAAIMTFVGPKIFKGSSR
jgi:formimidoylglutamase